MFSVSFGETRPRVLDVRANVVHVAARREGLRLVEADWTAEQEVRESEARVQRR